MPDRHLPVRPDLTQLRHQAKDLLRALRAADADATTEFVRNHPAAPAAATAKLADAQLALARAYGVASWPRLVQACAMTDAIWRDDVDAVVALVQQNHDLLHEDARGLRGNWGPPMSYAANLGRDRIIDALLALGARDHDFAFARAVLQGRIDTARRLHARGARPEPGALMGPAETQNAEGMRHLLELGAPIADAHGHALAPVACVLQTYTRNPTGKHACLELFAAHGIALPDTPTMAVHRGRHDLLAAHVARDRRVLARTFAHAEIYPPELGCDADRSLALHGTELAGGTLLHLCVDSDELDLARFLLDAGAPVDARAAVDPNGFGGHTALFGCVVSQPYRVGRRHDDEFARLLLDRGADPNARANLRKRLRFVADETLHEYRDVTPLRWGQRFHDQDWVSPAVLRLLVARGGT